MCKACSYFWLSDVTCHISSILSTITICWTLKLKQYSIHFYSMSLIGATILLVMSALCVWASQYHVQNALSVWSLDDVPRNSHDFRITYINPGCQRRPHPFLSKQPVSSCFFSVLTNHRWADSTAFRVKIFSLKRFSNTQDLVIFLFCQYIWLSNVTTRDAFLAIALDVPCNSWVRR